MAHSVTIQSNASGSTPLELVAGDDGTGIWLSRDEANNELLSLLAGYETTWAESPDTEGARRVRDKAENITRQGKVTIGANDVLTFEQLKAQWGQVIESIRTNKGELVYTPDDADAVTYDIERVHLVSAPQNAPLLSKFLVQSEFEITVQPYGRLATLPATSQVTSSLPFLALDIGDREYLDVVMADGPALYWRLGTNGTDDRTANNRDGTGGGGIIIGGQAGALLNDPDGATDFDGTDDRITSSYAVWADGVVRTFEGWNNRDNSSSADTLVAGGGASAAYPNLRLSSGSNDVVFNVRNNDTGATSQATWTGAWPGNVVWVHWALIWDGVNDVAELFINGVSKGVVTGLTQTVSTPGNFQVGAGRETFALPFDGKMDEIAVYEYRVTPERIWMHYVAGKIRQATPGSVDAWLKATLTDAATQNRDLVPWGVERDFDPSNPAPIILDSDYLTITGLAGAFATRSGAYDDTGGTTLNAIRATLTTTPVVVCSTGSQEHLGRWRPWGRFFASGTGQVSVRLAWRVGSGPWSYKPWIPLLDDQFTEKDLCGLVGPINVPEAQVGTQSWEGRIEAKSTVAGDTVDVDYLGMIPADRYGKARAPIGLVTPSVFSAESDFTTESGVITGDPLRVGGTWSGSGDADDVSVAVGLATRVATGDAAGIQSGRLLRASTPTLSTCVVGIDFKWAAVAMAATALGVLARYVDTSNFLAAYADAGGGLHLVKRVAGTTTELDSASHSGQTDQWQSIRLFADPAGNVMAWFGPQGVEPETPALTAKDGVLATGGALDDGAVGFFDHTTGTSSPTPGTRTYDNFIAWVPEFKHVINSGKRLVVDHESVLSEPASGTVWGRPPDVQGAYLKIPPSGQENRCSRIVVMARRNDTDELPSDNITDSLASELEVTPRVALLG